MSKLDTPDLTRTDLLAILGAVGLVGQLTGLYQLHMSDQDAIQLAAGLAGLVVLADTVRRWFRAKHLGAAIPPDPSLDAPEDVDDEGVTDDALTGLLSDEELAEKMAALTSTTPADPDDAVPPKPARKPTRRAKPKGK